MPVARSGAGMRATGTLDKSARRFGAAQSIDVRAQLKAVIAGLIAALLHWPIDERTVARLRTQS